MTTDNDQRDSDWVPRAKYETASKAAMKAMDSSAAWKKAHENLLAVRQQDITALTNRAEKAEAERDALRGGVVPVMGRQATHIADLQAECARLREDAERYRWLRSMRGASIDEVYKYGGNEELDAAIDAARGKP